jgi:putative transposase
VTVVVQAYRFALDPAPGQVRDLERHAGAARFAFNWALGAVRANLSQREAERSYGVAEAELTPVLGWSLPALRRPGTLPSARLPRGGGSVPRKRSTPA